MDIMFWIWIGVIVVTAVVEAATMEIVSIWFTIGAIVPLILAATGAVSWEWQLIIFIALSAILIISLRNITKKYLLRNSNEKTNLDTIIGKEYRMSEETDFDSVGSVKINGVTWSAIEKDRQTILKGEIVRVVKIDGNKLIVEKIGQKNKENLN